MSDLKSQKPKGISAGILKTGRLAGSASTCEFWMKPVTQPFH